MKRSCGVTVLTLALWLGSPALPADAVEPPMLGLEVSTGKLPPVQKRLPVQPLVVDMEHLGKHGGTLHSLVGRSRDTRLLVPDQAWWSVNPVGVLWRRYMRSSRR